MSHRGCTVFSSLSLASQVIQKNRGWATVALGLAAGGLFLLSRALSLPPDPVLKGLGLAVVLVFPSFWSLSWALSLSDKIFYSVFVGGVLFRLAGLFLGAAAMYRFDRGSLAPFLIWVLGGFLVLFMIETFFIQDQARSHGI